MIFIYIYIHSDHIMATSFDRKAVIIKSIRNIFKVQQSEHSVSAHFVVPYECSLCCTLNMFLIGLKVTALRSKHVAIM